ncbi:hypothetical protein HJC23_000873 [Cyclotella cryptica]|uniref:Uncharacterized protein n=1 Tax=Cyclotella cryptica TaxID=29204 RepID=A0ABD3PVK3_9STRA|eukprot:CCRYP_011594-RA/>CCRYP_011594-RA protein AED:0.25 eAED:0.25 QI:0/-1/0/1/-1/1/1/0/742
MNRAKARSQQKLNIAVDPLLQAIFDIPQTIPVSTQLHNQSSFTNGQTSIGGKRIALPRSSATLGSSRHSSPRAKAAAAADDDGVASDNSILVGESISLTDDDFSDAAYYSPPAVFRSSNLSERGNVDSHCCDKYSRLGPTSRNGITSKSSNVLKIDTIVEGDDDMVSNLSKKKKKRSSALKSLKKLVGYKGSGNSKLSNSSRKSLASTSSFAEDESINSHTLSGESLTDQAQNLDNRIPALRSKITTIRSNILSLERSLVATHNELTKAHEHLLSANFELGELQRAAIEVEIGLSNLSQRRGGMSSGKFSFYSFSEGDTSARSTRSGSSDRLHFLTPTSSLVDGEESDACFTPRSTASFESVSSQIDDKDIIQPIFTETNDRRVDVDATPLTKNTISKRSRPHNIDVSPSIYDTVPSETSSTAASTLESFDGTEKQNSPDAVHREQNEIRVTFCKQESFIRAHDLSIANQSDSKLLRSLHADDLSEVIDALFERGLQAAMDESDNWIPVRDTEKILSKRTKRNAESEGPMGSWPNAASGTDVLVWSAPCTHDGHGSEYPMVKARGLIPTSALQVVELLLDSNSVKRYNKMSLGRVDEHCFSKGVNQPHKCPNTGIQGEAKIVRSKTQPPIVRKPVELRILLHARRLHSDGEKAKYITIGRSVWETPDGKAEAADTSATRCEMLLSANLVRDLDCDSGENWCEITTITHAVSPGGIPLSIGKRVGLAAAGNYVKDIRAVFENC